MNDSWSGGAVTLAALLAVAAVGPVPALAGEPPVLTVRTVADLSHALAARSLLRRRGIALAAPGFAGRVVRSPAGAVSDRWDANETRRLVFFLGPDGLDLFVRSPSDRAYLSALGYPDPFLAEHRALGTRFELVAFASGAAHAGDLVPATWDGVARVVRRAYGEPIGARVAQVLPGLRRSAGIAEFERAAGAALADVARAPGHRARITARKLAQLTAAELAPWHVRFFLALEANVNELFAGDGFTRRPDGTRGLSERVGENGKIAAVGSVVRVELVP